MTDFDRSIVHRFEARRTLTSRFLLALAMWVLASCVDSGPDGYGSSNLLQFDSQTDAYSRSVLLADVEAVQASADIVDVLATTRRDEAMVQARAGTHERPERDPKPLWDAQFRLGSASQVFTAVVVLQLVSEGELALTDTVDTWLPGVVQGHGNDGRLITIEQLLQHTSGLFDYASDAQLAARSGTAGAFAQHRFDAPAPEELLTVALQHEPASAPGARFHRSSTNYVLLGMIIEAATGRDFREHVEQRIIAKLGLSRTYLPGYAPFLVGRHLHGFAGFPDHPALVDVSATSLVSGAEAGVVSTLSDLTLFLRALVRGQLLSPAAWEQMQRTVPTADPAFPDGRYGLGLAWAPLPCGGGYWHHAGDALGYAVRTGVTSDGARSVAVVMNSPLDDVHSGPAVATLIANALCATH